MSPSLFLLSFAVGKTKMVKQICSVLCIFSFIIVKTGETGFLAIIKFYQLTTHLYLRIQGKQVSIAPLQDPLPQLEVSFLCCSAVIQKYHRLRGFSVLFQLVVLFKEGLILWKIGTLKIIIYKAL